MAVFGKKSIFGRIHGNAHFFGMLSIWSTYLAYGLLGHRTKYQFNSSLQTSVFPSTVSFSLSLSLFHAISLQRIFSIRDVATYDAQGTPLFTVRQAINLFHCVSAQMLTHTHKAQTNTHTHTHTHTHDVYKMLKYEPRRSHSVYSFNFGSIDKHYGGDAAWFFAFSFLSHFFNRNNRSNELYTHSKHSP